MSRVVLFGTGRGASIAHRFLAADTDHEIVGFTVDGANISMKDYRGLPVVAFEEVQKLYPPESCRMLILLGYQQMNGLRQQKFAAAKAKGYTLETSIASDIFQAEPIKAGENCFIMDNQSISLDVEIGDNVVMWSSNHIGDLTRVADHAWIASHVTVAANARIGGRAFLGIGATVTNGVSIGAESFIGANLMVSADTAAKSVHVLGQGKIEFDSRAFMRSMIAGKKL